MNSCENVNLPSYTCVDWIVFFGSYTLLWSYGVNISCLSYWPPRAKFAYDVLKYLPPSCDMKLCAPVRP